MNETSGATAPSTHQTSKPDRRRYPPGLLPLLVVMALAAGLLGWRVVASGLSADRAAKSAQQVSEVLNRRAPTLEYLACRDAAEFAFQDAQAAFLLALFDLSGLDADADPVVLATAREEVVEARGTYAEARRQLLAVTDPTAPLAEDAGPGEPHRCQPLPSVGEGG